MTRTQSQQNYGIQITKYAWLTAAALIMALILGAFAGIAPVTADGDSTQNGIDTDAARYQAMEQYYLSGDADSARWAALGNSYAQESTALPYTDVAKFYSERSRAQADDSLPYTDVAKFYSERSRAQANQGGTMAADPELSIARRSYSTAANILATNPELSVARQTYNQDFSTCSFNSDDRLATNPELVHMRQASTC